MGVMELAIYGIGGLFALIILILMGRRIANIYHRVPPSQVMVIYGRGKTVFGREGDVERIGVRLVTGGGAFVWPIVEDFGNLDLTVMTIAKAKDEVYTVDGVPIRLDWVAQVQIDSDEISLLTAGRAFLGRSRDDVKNVIAQTLSANFRAIVGQLTVEDVHRDRDAFVNRVQQLASDDMAAMGVRVISMGIEEITDDQGYFEAMAKPVIAIVKRDAVIAEAEAEREARIKAAEAKRQAEQAELDATRAIVEQKQALELREVEKVKTVGLAQAESDMAVQEQRASAIEKEKEAELLVPARAEREAIEIRAEAERKRVTITAEAKAEAVRKEASGQAEATEVTGRAEAEKWKALKLAEAEGTRATLLAEAEGKEKIAQATAAEGEINLRQVIAELFIQAEVEKTEAIGTALKGIGENVKIVQFSGSNGEPNGRENALVDLLMDIPEVATVVNAKTEALAGENIEGVLKRVQAFLTKDVAQESTPDAPSPTPEKKPTRRTRIQKPKADAPDPSVSEPDEA
jgi:flotillin